MSFQSVYHILILWLSLLGIIVICAPTSSESRKVVFLAQPGIARGQILTAPGIEKSCKKCHIRDHRGNCRRIVSYRSDGISCIN